MINSTPAEYVFIRVCIWLLGAIVPVSILGTVYSAFADSLPKLPTIPLPLQLYFAVETLFWLGFQLPLYHSIQKEARHPPLLSEKQRRTLFARVTRDVGAADLEHHIRWWFRGAPLSATGRESFKHWLAWAFFEGRIDERGAADELEEYTRQFESLLGQDFAKGHGTARPIRLTLDKVELRGYRSLTWYFMVGFVDFLTYVRLWWYGFQHCRVSVKQLCGLFPFRPVALTARKRSPVKHLSYWHRPHTAKDRLPVLFIHGIGIGLYPYVEFLHELKDEVNDEHGQGQVGVIALEIMPVAFRVTHSALSKDDMCKEINAILVHHGWDKFVLIGHSYGTVIATHVLHNEVLRPKISSILLIDPVCFLLHTPDVAYNFTVRNPTFANEWQLWYFASQDPGVAHTLGRRFFWSENVLWLDDLLPLMEKTGLRMTVSLAERDLIVNTEAVGKYISGATSASYGTFEGDWRQTAWEGKGFEVIWNEDRDHAQIFDSKRSRMRLVGVVKEYCKGVA
ncbi:hypothetical protein CKM354_000025100 [Cercospora kikuchii]|uniref:AB hydrolase-1 domain-containing protein n=1 Tax=Cercospora kikuchii TaxID=84275 RepID=A0A9P3C5G0_9PEZI|nr:uncharacterized protein CKM354_000025100 [Cercospora kikuchii]GIZ36784.1 hypothetical protein CKM354_000025100 [Cercospora kikuchii]